MLSHFSHVQLFACVAHQAPLSIGSSRQEYWSRSPCSSLGDLPNPGIESESLKSPAFVSKSFVGPWWLNDLKKKKNLPAMWETQVQFLDQGRSPGEGHGNPLQYSCLENPHGLRSLVSYSPWVAKSD